MLTNEDDCSPGAGQALFDTASNNSLASPLGPPTSFRCNEFGHLCGGVAPGRMAPNGRVGDMFTYDSCEPAEDAGMLKTVADTAAQLRALKADPASQIVFASIQGSTGPYTVHWRDPLPPDTMPWPEMAHELHGARFTSADPGIRTANLAFGFADKGFVFSICGFDFVQPLTRFAQAIGGLFAPSCIADPIADDLKRSGVQPDCKVTARANDGSGALVDKPVPSCDDNGGTPPCWSLAPGGPLCVGQVLLLVPDSAAPTTPTVSYDCAVCTPGVAAQGCP